MACGVDKLVEIHRNDSCPLSVKSAECPECKGVKKPDRSGPWSSGSAVLILNPPDSALQEQTHPDVLLQGQGAGVVRVVFLEHDCDDRRVHCES